MSDDNFIGRWSRRKQLAKAAEILPLDAAAEPATPESLPGDVAAEPLAPAEERFDDLEDDLSTEALPPPDRDEPLPDVADLTGASDITGFLRRGVPEALRNAALRKAWSLDPAIRDFVGPAEYAWDFNDPASIPGFGAVAGGLAGSLDSAVPAFSTSSIGSGDRPDAVWERVGKGVAPVPPPADTPMPAKAHRTDVEPAADRIEHFPADGASASSDPLSTDAADGCNAGRSAMEVELPNLAAAPLVRTASSDSVARRAPRDASEERRGEQSARVRRGHGGAAPR